MSTFSENSKVQSDHPEPTGGVLVQPHSMASSDGVLADNTPALANEETTTPASLPVTGSMDGRAFLRPEADNTKPASNPAADRNQSGKPTVADKWAPSNEIATSQVTPQISEIKLRFDQDSISEIPKFELTLTPDLIREKSGKIRVSVVAWGQSGPELSRHESVDINGKSYSVPQLLPALRESLLLPTGLADYGTTRDLFENVRDLLNRYLALINNQDEILAYWCIATWFSDVLDFIPRLTITGPGFAGDVLLRVLRCVSHRPVLLASMNAALMKTIPINDLMPTLLIRETGLSKRKAELLDALDQKDYLVASGTEIGQFYCAKCIYLGEDDSHQAVVSDGIHVHVGDIRLPALRLPPAYEIESFQNKLFRYRSLHYDRVKVSTFTPEGLLPELRAVAQQLGSAIVGDDDLPKRIVDLLKDQSEQVGVDRSSGRKAMVLRAVLFHCHQGDQQVFARELAATVNQIYIEEGESVKVTSETVGHVLKGLSLYSRRLGNGGRGLVLDQSTQSKAHELSRTYEVLPATPACGYCHRLQVPGSKELV